MHPSLKPAVVAGLIAALLGANASQASTFVYRQAAPGLAAAQPQTAPPAQASASLSPSALSFVDTVVGASSTALTVTLSNTGSLALAVQTPYSTGDFSVTSACPASLDIGQTCGLSVTFSPTVTGARVGTLSLDTAAGTQSVALSGTGVTSGLSILSAIYGTVAQPKDMSAKLQLKCNGLQSCSYNPLTVYGSDPVPGQSKYTMASYTCGAGRGRHYGAPEASATAQVISCTTFPSTTSTVLVTSATFGGNRGASGNLTAKLQAACDGTRICKFAPAEVYGSDPYPSQAKDVSITYTCSTGGAPRTLTDAAGTGDQTVHTMTCP